MIRSAIFSAAVTSLAACSFVFAQDAQGQPAPPQDQAQVQESPAPPPSSSDQPNPAPSGTWRRADDPAPAPSLSQRPNYAQYPNYGPDGQIQNQNQNQNPGPSQGQYPANRPAPPPVPPQLTLKPGTYITARVNQTLSSDRNHAGDAFTATLVRPIVVDGVIVAQRGQTIGGVVKEAIKAGRVEGTSRLAVSLTDLTLVDGQNVPIQSQLITWKGDTSVGRDVAGVGATTATGAAIGAAVNGGVGAGVGAGAGLIVGAIGVLLTRGHPTIIYPEAVLTFRVEAPVTISTERTSYAFRYIDPSEYDRPASGPQVGYRPPPAPGPYYGYPYPYYAYGYPYPYWGFYPGFYGRVYFGGGYRHWR